MIFSFLSFEIDCCDQQNLGTINIRKNLETYLKEIKIISKWDSKPKIESKLTRTILLTGNKYITRITGVYTVKCCSLCDCC